MHGAARGHFRAHARRRVRLDVRVDGPADARARRAQLVDVSLRGAGLEIDGPLAVGDRLVLSVTTPTLWEPVRVAARVVWAEDGDQKRRAGCAFEHATAEDVQATWEMVASLVDD